MRAVVSPPMPPPTTITFIANSRNQRAIMVRKVRRVQRFSPGIVDGTGRHEHVSYPFAVVQEFSGGPGLVPLLRTERASSEFLGPAQNFMRCARPTGGPSTVPKGMLTCGHSTSQAGLLVASLFLPRRQMLLSRSASRLWR